MLDVVQRYLPQLFSERPKPLTHVTHVFDTMITVKAQPAELPCATLSMLTYYRTSRSLHFPFWAVCSLSGAQPEIWSVSWKPPVHRIAFGCLLFLSIQRSGVRARWRVRGPRAPLAPSTVGRMRPNTGPDCRQPRLSAPGPAAIPGPPEVCCPLRCCQGRPVGLGPPRA